MDHVGIVVDDLAAATAFFVEVGLKLQVEGGWVDRVVGLAGVRSEIAMLETPDGSMHGVPGCDSREGELSRLGARGIVAGVVLCSAGWS